MLGINTGITLRPRIAGQAQVVGYYTLTTSQFVSAIGIYVESDPDTVQEMIQLIPVYEQKDAGTYPIVWDGYDYNGNDVIATNDYVAKVLKHNVTYDYWICGSNSTLKHGISTFRGYSPNVGVFFAGDKVFFNHSWDEGQNIKGAYVDKSVDIHYQLNIGYGGISKFSGPAFEFGCKVPGQNMALYGGENSASGYEGDNIVYAVNTGTDALLTFANGTTYSVGVTSYSVLYQGLEVISGITASNGYAYVTFAGTDTVRIYDLGTVASPDGTLVDTVDTTTISASWATPIVFQQSFDDSNWGERIWAMNKTTSQVFMLEVNAGTGALTLGTLTTAFGSGYKVSLAVDNVNHVLAFIVGAGYQQIRFFNIDSANPGGSVFKTWGTALGYESGIDCAVVTNTKWSFFDNSTGIDKGTPRGFIGFSGDGEFWVGDTGNRRTLQFTFTFTTSPSRDYTFTYVDQVDQIGAVYNVAINDRDATEHYINGLRYTVDLDTGEYTLTHNYQAQMSYDNMNGRDIINEVTSRSTSGGTKRIACLNNYSTTPSTFPLFELTDDGIVDLNLDLNETGLYLGNFLDEDFTIKRIYSAGGYTAGQTPKIQYQTVDEAAGVWTKNGFDDIVTLDPIASGDLLTDSGNTAFQGVTSDGYFLMANGNKDATINHHLTMFSPTGVKKWEMLQRTPKVDEGGAGYTGHNGQIPPPFWIEVANGVNDTFYKAEVCGDWILLSANYEDYKSYQGNYRYLFHKSGMPVKLIGTNRWKSEAIEDHGVEADGNCQYFHMVEHTDGRLVVNASSEGGQAGSQIHVIDVSTVQISTIPVAPPTYETIIGARQFLELDPVSIFSDTAHIVLSEAQSADFKVETNINYPDRSRPDFRIFSTSGANATRYATVTIDPVADGSMKSWQLRGQLNFMGYIGAEATNAICAFIKVKDGSGNVITQIGLGSTGFNYYLWANGTVIFTATDSNDMNNYLYEWNDFLITVNSLGCEITFGNEDKVFVDFVEASTWNDPTTIDIGTDTNLGGDGIGRAIGVNYNLDYYDTDVVGAAPTVTSRVATNATTIRQTYDMAVDLTNVGYSYKKNGSNLAISAVTEIAPNIWDFTVAAIANGDTLLGSYNSATGDTLNGDGTELVSYTDVSVTNSVPASNITFVNSDSIAAAAPELGLDTPAFNLVAGNTVLVAIRTYNATSVSSLTDTAGNTYTLDAYYTSQFKQSIYSCINCLGNATNVISFGASAFDASLVLSYVQLSGTITTFEQEVTGTSTADNNVTSNSFTTVQAYEYALCFVSDYAGSQVWTAPTGYTSREIDTETRTELSDKAYTSVQIGITLTASSATAPNFDKQMLIALYRY